MSGGDARRRILTLPMYRHTTRSAELHSTSIRENARTLRKFRERGVYTASLLIGPAPSYFRGRFAIDTLKRAKARAPARSAAFTRMALR